MTKSEFVELVKEKGEFSTKAMAENAVKVFLDSITEVLKKGDSVTFVGFGTFSAVKLPEKSGKIPGSDKTYTKPAHMAPKFKAGKSLKDSVAAGK